MFGEDPKVQEWAKRLTDPISAGKMLLAAQQRIRSGEYKRVAPPDDADAEAIKAWRAEQGIPTEAKDYPSPLPAGADMSQLDEAGKARIDHFNQTFHKLNLTTDQGKALYEAYNAQVEKDAQATAAADAQLMDATEDALRADWGRDFKANIQMNLGFLDKTLGGDLTDALMGARAGDGRLLMNIPEVAKWINSMARAEGGDYLDPGADGGSKGSDQARLEAIRQVMNTDMGRYQREGLDVEYGQILERLEKRGKLTDPSGPMS